MNKSMRIALYLCALCLAIGFGYVLGTRRAKAEFEDYAVSNIMSELVYAALLQRNDTDQMRSLMNVSLANHLKQVRLHQGAISNSAYESAKTRTLVGVLRLWQKSPPFTSPDFMVNKDQPWFAEWQRQQEENMRLLEQADQECKKSNCKPNAPSATTSGSSR